MMIAIKQGTKTRIISTMNYIADMIGYSAIAYIIYFCIKGAIISYATSVYVLQKLGFDVSIILPKIILEFRLLEASITVGALWIILIIIKKHHYKKIRW